MKNTGYNIREALTFIERQQKERPGPYTLVGFCEGLDIKKTKMRPKPADSPLHDTIFLAYEEFRGLVPEGRHAMVLGAKFDPEEWDPKNAIFMDTQLVEKAMKSKDYEKENGA